MDNSFTISQTCSTSGSIPNNLPHIPAGQIMVSDRWRNTSLAIQLSRTDHIILYSDLGEIDFYFSQDCSVLFISEAAFNEGKKYKLKVVKLKKANIDRAVIVAERTPLTFQQFISLQKLAVIELGLRLIPISSQAELPQLLSQMVKAESQAQKNQFKLRPSSCLSHHDQVLATLCTIPLVKDKRAEALLKHYGSLHKIALASLQDLTTVVGPFVAESVRSFFNQPN